ncbi:MAG: response regulator transcription factor [Thioalkalivibrio sp.]|jgi:two-component system response regulator FixJ|nr:response regulator transcription factor [Thioalkalivibrio sp.]
MTDEFACVHVVDDDPDVREAVSFLLESEGLASRSYPDATSLLETLTPEHAGCLVLDVRLPDLDGITLQNRLLERGIEMPRVFITGHGDIPMAVRAVENGALDFIEKPFDDEQLLDAIQRGLENDAHHREALARRAEAEKKLAELTPREREVLDGLVDGKPSKIIAYELGVSVRTVEIHRGNIMDKTGARNASQVVRLALQCAPYRDRLLDD